MVRKEKDEAMKRMRRSDSPSFLSQTDIYLNGFNGKMVAIACIEEIVARFT